jgi:2-amino-4-hydroxy-6-hydroxymethyldihydropteridine diphosphokinase
MNGIYLLLGTNLGDRFSNIKDALNLLEKEKVVVIKRSSIYETAAWGKTDQQDFLNQVVEVTTNNSPYELLETILNAELSLGRVRKEKWGERVIDIDILFYHDQIISTPKLSIPHPAIHERLFTLKPLAEIAGEKTHPKHRKKLKVLMDECSDKLPVAIWK